MADEQETKKSQSNFVVLLETANAGDDVPAEPPIFKLLSDGHKDTATAKAWLKRNLAELTEKHGKEAIFRIASLQAPMHAEVKMVSKLTID